MSTPSSFTNEIDSFKPLWKGGYYEGDPLDPFAVSGYGTLGYLSVLYVTYRICIRPYVNANSQVLEIGPGRGTFTKCMLDAKQVWCLDALSAEHNHFWEHLEYPKNVKYYQVKDFKCNMLPCQHFDFLFSFGCFCHISPNGYEDYMMSLFPKMKTGAHGFIMIADYDKYNHALSLLHQSASLVPGGRRYLPVRFLERLVNKVTPTKRCFRNKDEDRIPRAGRWYHLGKESACATLERLGYRVVESDVEINHRDPIIHFVKP